jgi:hypothetical protein
MAAAPTVVAFTDRYPEFGEIPAEYTALVQAALDEAAESTNADVYPTDAACTTAVMLQAAVLLSQSPFARKMRLGEGAGLQYEYRLRMRQRAATMGRRVF